MSLADHLGWAALACARRLPFTLAALSLASAAALAQPAPPASGGSAGADLQPGMSCDMLAASAWPRSKAERDELLLRLEAARQACTNHAPFLATLGGNWLEAGQPDQAVLWLERALMLDPDQLAAQADYALALSALGDSTARRDLLERWAQRNDIPRLVWLRLQGTNGAVAAAGNGQAAASSRWAQIREFGLYAGYESNLDRSPRLTELTLTPPDGTVQLPLAQPIKPRQGSAAVAELSWQTAYSPRQGSLLQFGLIGTARAAPTQSETDWNYLQFAASIGQRWRVKPLKLCLIMKKALNEPPSKSKI